MTVKPPTAPVISRLLGQAGYAKLGTGRPPQDKLGYKVTAAGPGRVEVRFWSDLHGFALHRTGAMSCYRHTLRGAGYQAEYADPTESVLIVTAPGTQGE